MKLPSSSSLLLASLAISSSSSSSISALAAPTGDCSEASPSPAPVPHGSDDTPAQSNNLQSRSLIEEVPLSKELDLQNLLKNLLKPVLGRDAPEARANPLDIVNKILPPVAARAEGTEKSGAGATPQPPSSAPAPAPPAPAAPGAPEPPKPPVNPPVTPPHAPEARANPLDIVNRILPPVAARAEGTEKSGADATPQPPSSAPAPAPPAAATPGAPEPSKPPVNPPVSPPHAPQARANPLDIVKQIVTPMAARAEGAKKSGPDATPQPPSSAPAPPAPAAPGAPVNPPLSPPNLPIDLPIQAPAPPSAPGRRDLPGVLSPIFPIPPNTPVQPPAPGH